MIAPNFYQLIATFKANAVVFALAIILTCTGCISTETKDGPLSKALEKALREKRISESYVDDIVKEYTAVDVSNADEGQRYANALIAVIDRGGDSTAIAQVRRKFRKTAD